MRISSMSVLLNGVVLFALTATGCSSLSSSAGDKTRFAQNQCVEVQIVTVPANTVPGGISYSEDEVKTHASHLIRIPVTGEGLSVQSTVDGVGIEMIYEMAEPVLSSGKQQGIVFHNLRFHLSMIRFEISPSASLAGITTTPGYSRSVLTTAFSPVGDIHCTGENKPRTFLRARWVPHAPEETVILLYDSESASRH